jgi:serine/threonine-protein kinase
VHPADTLNATMMAPPGLTAAPRVSPAPRAMLRATRAMALSRSEGDAGARRMTTATVLPRIEVSGSVLRLVPTEGSTRYTDTKLLGRGGMGEVSLAADADIGRTVAVKRLLDPTTQHPAVLARFVDEIRTVGSLEHPNIIPIHDVGVDEQGRYFFVMKYVDGETLEELIEKLRAGDPHIHARFPQRRRLEIFVQILRALHYAHSRGIIHRDLKPANVMIGRYGEVVVMDWGIARPIGRGERPEERPAGEQAERAPRVAHVDRIEGAAIESPRRDDATETRAEVGSVGHARAAATELGAIVGTPLYASPEQAMGETDTLDARSDLFSATVLLHEWLTLRHRFEEVEALDELLHKVVTTPPPAPPFVLGLHAAQKETVPYELAHFIRRGWQLDREARWPSAQAMIDDLEAILDGRCRVQCPTTLLKRSTSSLTHFVDHRPGLAMLVMYGAALTFVVLGLRALWSAIV